MDLKNQNSSDNVVHNFPDENVGDTQGTYKQNYHERIDAFQVLIDLPVNKDVDSEVIQEVVNTMEKEVSDISVSILEYDDGQDHILIDREGLVSKCQGFLLGRGDTEVTNESELPEGLSTGSLSVDNGRDVDKGSEERVFICGVCKLSLRNLSELNSHYTSHGDYMKRVSVKKKRNMEYICSVCDKKFRKEQDLIIHDKWHKGVISYGCSCCWKEFSNVKFLVLHMVKEHIGDICIYGSVRNSGLNSESNLSDDICNQSIKDIPTSKICGESLSVKNELDQEKVEKDSEYSFFCDTCGKGFAKRRALIRHLCVHSEQESLTCIKCSKGFISRARLVLHMKTHNEDKKFVCETCGSHFPLNSRLTEHIKEVHTVDRPFICSICGKEFTTKKKLKKHVKLHNGERLFLCSVCGKSFATNANLNKHMQLHSKEKAFVCSICGKQFLQYDGLNYHKKIHLTNKPFVCSWCGKSFRTRGDLVKHERIHSGDTPFKCSTCGKGFAQKVQLRLHYKVHPPP